MQRQLVSPPVSVEIGIADHSPRVLNRRARFNPRRLSYNGVQTCVGQAQDGIMRGRMCFMRGDW